MFSRLANYLFGERFAVPRSPEWPRLRAAFLRVNPRCAVCSTTKGCVPHHIQPVHIRPDLELSWDNLITLCESKTHNCHLIWGHLLSFRDSWNLSVREDAEIFCRKIAERPNRGKTDA